MIPSSLAGPGAPGVTGRDDLTRLRLLAEEQIKRSLERIEGVAAAVVSGGLEEEIQVEVDERSASPTSAGASTAWSRACSRRTST